MRVLVFGGRDFGKTKYEQNWLYCTLDTLHRHHNFTVLIHGAANGVDSLAAEWASQYEGEIFTLSFPADWKKHGNAAGPIRNSQMLTIGLPDLAIGFPGGKGTADMIAKVAKAGVPLTLITS